MVLQSYYRTNRISPKRADRLDASTCRFPVIRTADKWCFPLLVRHIYPKVARNIMMVYIRLVPCCNIQIAASEWWHPISASTVDLRSRSLLYTSTEFVNTTLFIYRSHLI